ncbi:unnamed protein product [Cylindrotheca closterium]|uniref:Uncharacterized protein n=1 Tax=Cylindrotheca closterium TaxID=2856 RepID=A0AAD2GAG7_9STRA|nr:unnamed protein product [Cylindrotheca closterium]
MMKRILALFGFVIVMLSVFRGHTNTSPLSDDISSYLPVLQDIAKPSSSLNHHTTTNNVRTIASPEEYNNLNVIPSTGDQQENEASIASDTQPINSAREALVEDTVSSSSSSSCVLDEHQKWEHNCTRRIPLNEYISMYRQELSSLKSKSQYANNKRILRTNPTLWQTWKDHTFPGQLESYWMQVMDKNPDRQRKVLVDSEIDSYVQTNCPGSYWEMYNQTNPSLHALRADLWRYCVLFNEGGVYMDADVGVNKAITLSSWIKDNVVLSQGGNHFDAMVTDCTPIWKSINFQFPQTILMTNNSVAQWAMIFPRPKHPILLETMNLATALIGKWVDTNSTTTTTKNETNTNSNNQTSFPMKLRVVCLSGPAILAVAADKVYRSNQNSWDGLGVTMETGTDYSGKLQYKNYAYMRFLFNDEKDDNKRYDKMEAHVPLKV